MRRTVVAPDGSRWEVWNRWYRRPRLRHIEVGEFDLLDMAVLDFSGPGSFLAGLFLSIVVAVVLAVVIVAVLPLILFVLEIPVVVALVFVIRRLWIVEAVSSGGTRRAWQVRGWLGSRRAVREVARELETGVTAEPDEALGPA